MCENPELHICPHYRAGVDIADLMLAMMMMVMMMMMIGRWRREEVQTYPLLEKHSTQLRSRATGPTMIISMTAMMITMELFNNRPQTLLVNDDAVQCFLKSKAVMEKLNLGITRRR